MIDPRIATQLLRLDDAICERERDAGRGHTLILIPHDRREEVHISLDGKPVAASIDEAVRTALALRFEGT